MVRINRGDLLQVHRFLNTVIVSLDRIGSCADGVSKPEIYRLLSEFVIGWRVTPMLARARLLLSKPFSEEVGEDGMDELEREMEGIPYWSSSHRDPPPELLAEILETR